MKKTFLLNIILFLFLSCSDAKFEKHYYSSGEIQFLIELNNIGQRDGIFQEYYKNGQIKTTSNYLNGKRVDSIKGYFKSGELEFIQFESLLKRDSVYKFYKDGTLFSKGLIENRKISGWWDFYNMMGYKSHSIDYKLIQDSIINNQLKVYNDDLSIVKDSSYFIDQKMLDTMVVGKIYPFEITYHSNLSDSSTVFFCYSKNFDESFNNINSVKIDTLYTGSHTISSQIKRNEIGRSNFRGFFVEKHSEIAGVNSKDSTKVDIVTYENIIYIDKVIQIVDSIK